LRYAFDFDFDVALPTFAGFDAFFGLISLLLSPTPPADLLLLLVLLLVLELVLLFGLDDLFAADLLVVSFPSPPLPSSSLLETELEAEDLFGAVAADGPVTSDSPVSFLSGPIQSGVFSHVSSSLLK
jgi:hypothetical protein